MMSQSADSSHQTLYDVIVVGAGNAALCAAIAAAEDGAKVLVLERAPKAERGGNSTFTAGAMRVVYDDFDAIRELVPSLSDADRARVDFGAYSADDFRNDMLRLTDDRTDPEMLETLVTRSFETLKWMRDKGVPFTPLYERQSFEVEGKRKFWGGLTIGTEDGGFGLIESLTAAAEERHVEVWYETRAVSLIQRTDGSIAGVRVRRAGEIQTLSAKSVVLACGGFEANVEMRTKYMGPGWENAKVRGTRFNQGDGHKMAAEVDAMPYGQWSGAHAVFWEYEAPPYGNLAVSNKYSKLSYPLGVVLNLNGDRFIDEGADFRNYTYARYGREVLKQPGGRAWQIFDAKALEYLQIDYKMPHVHKVVAESLEELVTKLDGIDPERALKTLREFNEAIDESTPFDPNVKDGKCTSGLALTKSNWATRLDTAPFEAYAVTCGITFTFGGIRIAPESAEVLNGDGQPIPGLTAAGEIVGGLFYDNYPGGSGLTAGAVFGRIAGHTAATYALRTNTNASSRPTIQATSGGNA